VRFWSCFRSALEEQRRQAGQLNEALVIEKANSAQCMDRLDTAKEHSSQFRERTNHVIQVGTSPQLGAPHMH